MQSDIKNGTYNHMVILSEFGNENYVVTLLPEGTYNSTSQKYEVYIVGFVTDSLGAASISTLTLNV